MRRRPPELRVCRPLSLYPPPTKFDSPARYQPNENGVTVHARLVAVCLRSLTREREIGGGKEVSVRATRRQVWSGNGRQATGIARLVNEFLYPHKQRDDPFFHKTVEQQHRQRHRPPPLSLARPAPAS